MYIAAISCRIMTLDNIQFLMNALKCKPHHVAAQLAHVVHCIFIYVYIATFSCSFAESEEFVQILQN